MGSEQGLGLRLDQLIHPPVHFFPPSFLLLWAPCWGRQSSGSHALSAMYRGWRYPSWPSCRRVGFLLAARRGPSTPPRRSSSPHPAPIAVPPSATRGGHLVHVAAFLYIRPSQIRFSYRDSLHHSSSAPRLLPVA